MGTSESSESGEGLAAPELASARPSTSLSGAPNPNMIQSVTRIDRAIKERRETDEKLVNWWLYFLLLSWITFGLYGIYLFFKRITRIDGFSRRKQDYYSAVIEWTRRRGAEDGHEDQVHHDLTDLDDQVKAAYHGDMRPIKAGLSFVLTIVTLGLYGLYVMYRMNRYWWDAQILEQDFDDKLSQIWTTLGLSRYPITFRLDQTKKRSYPMYLILSIVTFGIWGLVWDYKIQTDPDNLYGEFHGVEDTVLQTVRAH
jgi:hypothetical protein